MPDTSTSSAPETTATDAPTSDHLANFAASLSAYHNDAPAPEAPVAAEAPAPEATTETSTQAPEATTTDTTTTAPEPAAFNEGEWLSTQFGEKYKTPDEVKAELAAVEKLRENQLTDEHRASLALLSDKDKAREYLRLSTAEYETMPDADVLRESFLLKNPGLPADVAEIRYERWLKSEFPSAAGVDPDHPDFEDSADFRADKKLMDFAVQKARTDLAAHRDQTVDSLLAGVKATLPAADTAAQEPTIAPDVQAAYDAYLADVDTRLQAPLDITVQFDGNPVHIKARETPEDVAATREFMLDPVGAIQRKLMPDGTVKSLDRDFCELLGAFFVQGEKLFTTAVQVGKDMAPPHVPLDKLTNGATPAPTPTAGQDPAQAFAGNFMAAYGS